MQSIPPLQVLFNQAARTTAPLRGLLWSLALRSSWATHSMEALPQRVFWASSVTLHRPLRSSFYSLSDDLSRGGNEL